MNQESWSSINNRSSLNLYFVSERETVKSSVGNAGFYTTRFGKRSVGPMAAFLNQERPEDYQLPDRYCLFSMCLHLRHKLFLENVTGSVPASDLMRTRLSSGATWRRRCLSSASTPNSWGDWSALTLTEQFTMIKWLSGQDPLKYLDKKRYRGQRMREYCASRKGGGGAKFEDMCTLTEARDSRTFWYNNYASYRKPS